MTQYYDVYPENPQSRTLSRMVWTLEEGRLIAYLVDSYYALGCALGNGSGIERIRWVRQLEDRHHLTLMISEFFQFGAFIEMSNQVFHAAKAVTLGPCAFILKAIREVPKMMQHPKKHTIGVRILDHRTTLALLDAVGSFLVNSIPLLPDHPEPLAGGWTTKELPDRKLNTILDSGDCGLTPTAVVDLSGDEPEVVRVGAGGLGPFE